MNEQENLPISEEIQEETHKKNKRSVLNELFDAIDAAVVALVVAMLILTLLFRTGYVDGPSMESTLMNGDRYVISGLFYTPKNGDIIVFQPDKEYENDSKLWVKRVIAVGGQTVDLRDGYVYVDGVKIDEPYLSKANSGNTVPKSDKITFPYKVPENYVFVMGDNRILSKDSRSIGAVDARRILGKLIVRFYPFNAIGPVD